MLQATNPHSISLRLIQRSLLVRFENRYVLLRRQYLRVDILIHRLLLSFLNYPMTLDLPIRGLKLLHELDIRNRVIALCRHGVPKISYLRLGQL